MNTSPVDPALIMQDAAQKDLVRRKLDMDALRKRLGDTTTQQEKLKESCEGFESIFLQKMWEQMRKTVNKEGYLHSKDEETYQSMFDVELCKKMASAGGIGLGEMLYQQLSQKLEDTGRTTTPGAYRKHMDMQASKELMAPAPTAKVASGAPAEPFPNPANAGKMTAENLYSELPEEPLENEALADASPPESSPMAQAFSAIDNALHEIRADLGLAPLEGAGAAVAAQTARQNAGAKGPLAPASTDATGASPSHPVVAGTPPQPGAAHAGLPKNPLEASSEAQGAPQSAGMQAGQNALHMPGQPANPSAVPPATPQGAQAVAQDNANQRAEMETLASPRKESSGLLASSWQGNGPVSAKPKPMGRLFGRNKNAAEAPKQAEASDPAAQRGMAPQNTVWPFEGVVASKFGWEDDPATGRRRWNSGIEIAAPPSTPVRAVLDGTVVFSGHRDGMGHTVVLEHADGFRSYYSNLEDNPLRVGAKVKHGSNFAKVAVQKSSSEKEENSAFLHFEFKRGEMALNPESAIRRMTTASK